MNINHNNGRKIIDEQAILYTVYTNAANMPFITVDEETKCSQVHFFTSADMPAAYLISLGKDINKFKGKAVRQEELSIIYTDLFMMGTDEVKLHNEEETYVFKLTELTSFRDFSDLPENQRPVMNQKLNEAVVLLIQEAVLGDGNSDALTKLNRRVSEKLAGASFVMPVQVTEEGFTLSAVKDEEGKIYQPVFTDNIQYSLFLKHDEPDASVRFRKVSLKDLDDCRMEGSQGFILNPGTYQFILTFDMIKNINEYFL